MPPAVAAIQAVHLDVVMPAPEDTRFLLTDPLDDEGLEAVAITHLTPQAERLVALFDPRHRK